MKLLNFYKDGDLRTGLARFEGVEDLTELGSWRGELPVKVEELQTLSKSTGAPSGPLVKLESLRLAPVVLAPQKIICVGLNYRRHAIEADMQIPKMPVVFAKYANSLSASGDRIVLPFIDTKYDYEAELGVVIGRRANNVSERDALNYVAGYCCANDLSARTAQLATSQWTLGKMLDGFLPLGPMLVTTDEVPDPQALRIRCDVNGERRQDSSTSDMIFSVAHIISFVSRHATLEPGDVIVTGTPEGVILGKASPEWLRPGDRVKVEIDGLGALENVLIAPELSR